MPDDRKPSKYDVVDHSYDGIDPFAPPRLRDPKQNRKRIMPGSGRELARIDPDWNEHNTE